MVVNFMVGSSTERGKLPNTLQDRRLPCGSKSASTLTILPGRAPRLNNKKAHGIEMPWGVDLIGSPPRAAFIVGTLRSCSDRRLLAPRRPLLEGLAQPVAGHVQAALDRADRRLELARHLLQGATLDVEGDQRSAVKRLEPIQTVPDLRAIFAADHLVERTGFRVRGILQDLRLSAMDRRLAPDAVDGHAHRDLAQPADEAVRVAQLSDLRHRVDEGFLRQLCRLVRVAQPRKRDAVDGAMDA